MRAVSTSICARLCFRYQGVSKPLTDTDDLFFSRCFDQYLRWKPFVEKGLGVVDDLPKCGIIEGC